MIAQVDRRRDDQNCVQRKCGEETLRNKAATPPGDHGHLGMSAGKTIEAGGLQAVERTLHRVEKPQAVKVRVLQVRQEESGTAHRNQEVADVGSQKAQRYQETVVAELRVQ